ncbi:hypothetical protein WJX72_004120 [[Myrmecia] bisecta]|uniref:EamA domain-containing protein n=1 Tax=[Myrmecia] bisecta TaxID=41462 RepID=A0AAW1QEU0_9CHLO
MVVMKDLSSHTTPLFVSAVRLLPAGLLLVAWAARSGRAQPSSPMAWMSIAVFGLIDGTGFQGFLAEGLQRTSAGLGSVIIDSQPLTVAVLAALLFGEELAAGGYVGMGLGVAGLCLLEVPLDLLFHAPEIAAGLLTDGPQAVSAAASSTGRSWSIWDSGEWWMLLAAQSMAVGTVLVPWVSRYSDAVMATGWHMVLGGIPLLALSVMQEADTLLPRLADFNGWDAVSLVYISVLGSAASYGVFFYNASRGNLTALSSLTFLTPMFAALTGYIFLGETLTPLQLAGATVTLGAVALINSNGKRKQAS